MLKFIHKNYICVEVSWSKEGKLVVRKESPLGVTISVIICRKRATTIWDCFLGFPLAMLWSYFFQRK